MSPHETSGADVTPNPPLARRSNTLSSSLGLGEKLFASSEERRFAAAIEAGLDADLVLLTGRVFEPGTRVQRVMVDGRFVGEEVP